MVREGTGREKKKMWLWLRESKGEQKRQKVLERLRLSDAKVNRKNEAKGMKLEEVEQRGEGETKNREIGKNNKLEEQLLYRMVKGDITAKYLQKGWEESQLQIKE